MRFDISFSTCLSIWCIRCIFVRLEWLTTKSDDEIDEGLDDETWNEAIEHEYFPDIVEKAIEDGECEVKVLFEK